MILVVTVLLLALVLAFVGYPLVRPATVEAEEVLSPAAEQREQLLAGRENALAALKDLEFERSVGNLSERDYALLQGVHRRTAVTILHELDGLAAASPGEVTPPPDSLDARVEEEIARARQRLSGEAGIEPERRER